MSVEKWVSGEPITAAKHNHNLEGQEDLEAAVADLQSRFENPDDGVALSFFARLTAETGTGVYSWKPIIRDSANSGWIDASNGMDSTTHGDARHVDDLENLPCDGTFDESSAKVRMWPVLNQSNVLVFQFELLTEKNGDRLPIFNQTVQEDNGNTAEASLDASDWDIETQDDDDIEGVAYTLASRVHYEKPYSNGSAIDGEINLIQRSMISDLGGKLAYVGQEETPLPIATVSQCPPMGTGTAAGIGGYYA